jgi:uncharacterized membrane protein YjjB (DUF3815 family)
MIEILSDFFWSGVAALAFSMLFNVPRRALLACTLLGAIGHASRSVLIEYADVSIAPATLIGAMAVGFGGFYCSRRYQMPVMIFTVSGSIPLVPGSYAFRAMIYILQVTSATNDAAIETALIRAGYNFISTGLILGALAFGIASPFLIFERRHPVV